MPADPEDFENRPTWSRKGNRQPSRVIALSRLLVLFIIAVLLALPFTPFAGKIKNGIKEIVAASREAKTITREVTRNVEVPKEVVKEVVKEVTVPAPPPPLPDKYVPRKEVDVASLYNGITIKTKLMTEQGTFASLERLNPEAYKAEFQLSVRVPKANQTLTELARINKHLPSMLPALGAMLESAKVSGFYHRLYDNKTTSIERDITRLNKVLDRHNFFDCETILEMTHPDTKRKALLIQSEMDVVADGSDGDRMPRLDEFIYMSDYYQPFTSYIWPKRTKTPNPLLARWEEKLKLTKEQLDVKGLSADRKRELKAVASQLDLEIKEMKSRSSLIAERDPFIVISLLFRPYASQNKFTPGIGDYALVIHDDKIYPAICGDYGPTLKVGEASLRVAKTVNPAATPYRRPVSDLKVTYVIFPGTAEKPFAPPDLDRWHARCSDYLKEIGNLGGSYALHRWEDLNKPPAPETAAPPAATPESAAPAPTPGAGPNAAGSSAPIQVPTAGSATPPQPATPTPSPLPSPPSPASGAVPSNGNR